MASVNGILTYLEHIDSKKNSLRKAILTLAVEWKDLDEHLDSTKNCIDACVIDIDLKQKNLAANRDSVDKTSRELDEARESLKWQYEELERKDEEFRLFQLAQVAELEMKEKRLGEVRMWIEERIGECEIREEKLSVQKKSMEVLLQKIEMEKEDFEDIQKSVCEKLKEIHLKERNYEDLCKEVSSIQDRMETWAKELKSKEEQLVKLQKLNEERGNELDMIARECELNKERLIAEKSSMEVKLEKFEMEKEKLDETKKFVDERLNEISHKERNCDTLSREVNLIQDWIERRSRELYEKEEEFAIKEEQLIAKQRLNENRTEELDSIARRYESKEKKLAMEKEEFQNIQNFVDKRWSEISIKEEDCDHRCKEVNLREEHVALREEQLKEMRRLNEECCEELHVLEKECKLKEEKLTVEQKYIEEQLGNIEKENKQREDFKGYFADKLNEISLKEKNMEDRSKELNSIQDWIERRAKELDLSEEQFGMRDRQLKALEKLNKERGEELDVILLECKLKQEKLSMEQKSIEVLLEKIDRENEDINGNKRSIAEKLDEINSKERNFENLSKEVNLLLDQVDKRAKELATREELVASREQLKTQLSKELSEKGVVISLDCKLKNDAPSEDRTLMETIEKEKMHFEDSTSSVADKLICISLKENNCNRVSKEVSAILEQIERLAIEFNSKNERLALREEQIKAMKKLNRERFEEVSVVIQQCKFIEGRLNVIRKSVEVILQEFEKEIESVHEAKYYKLKDEIHGKTRTSMEVRLEKLDNLNEELKSIQNSVSKMLKEISLKERNYEDLSKEVKMILDRVEKQARELDSKTEHISFRGEQEKEMRKLEEVYSLELDIVHRELDCSKKLVEQQHVELDTAGQDLDSIKISSAAGKINLKGKQLDLIQNDPPLKNEQLDADKKLFEAQSMELDSKERQLEEQSKEFKSKLKQLEEQPKTLGLKEKQLEDRSRENLCEERQFENSKTQQVEGMSTLSLSVEIQNTLTIDGRCLRLYVMEHYKDRTAMSNKVCEILQSSSDPAKLGLEAIEGFYTPHLVNGDGNVQTSVARRSCILLLEELMVLSPRIQPHTREAALKLSGDWRRNMRHPKDNIEAEAFILLVASYKLASNFDAVHLLECLDLCAMRPKSSQICRALDLAEKVPYLVSSLIRNNKHTIAVKFIVEFKLVKSYPLVPLLKDYVRISNNLIKARCRLKRNTDEAKDNALDERISCLRNVINCMNYHKIEAGKWCSELENIIRELRKEKIRKQTESPFIPKNAVQKSIDSNILTSSPALAPRRFFGSKKVFSIMLAHMDASNLLVFLNKYVEEHEHMRRDVSSALRLTSGSEKVVLDVVQVFYTSHLVKKVCDTEASVVRTCNFLLEILMSLSPSINPLVEKVAKDLAVGWKLLIMKQTTYVLTLGFLLFVGTYGLSSYFNSDELHKLYQTIGEHKLAPDLSRCLCFSGEILVSSNSDHFVQEDLKLSNPVSTASASDTKSLWNGIPDTIRYASDPAQLVLDAVEGCYYSMLTNRNISKVEVIRNLSFLLNRLLTVPLEVKPQVKDQANKFAADWNDKVKPHHRSEVGCILLFLAAYKLISSFPLDDLLNLLELAYDDKGAVSLFRSLGLLDEVPDFIGRLLERGEHLSAIKYVYAFDLINMFSPFTILEDYINNTKEEATKICEGEQSSPTSRTIANKLEIRAFKEMKDCICFHQLDSKQPFENLKPLIEQWEVQIFGWVRGGRQRKRGRGFVQGLPSASGLEPHCSRKRQRAALSSERMIPNCSKISSQGLHPGDFPMEQLPVGNYFPGASGSAIPYFDHNVPGGVSEEGYPMFGYSSCGHFDSGFNYNSGRVPEYW